MQKPKALARQKVFIVRFKDLTRWDTRHNQSFATNLKNAKSHTDSTTHEADENPAIAESANHSNAFSLDHKALLDSTPTPPPQGWEVKTLGDICETNIGLIYSPTNISNNEMGIVVLRSNNIQNGKIIYDDIIRVKDVAISPNKIAQKGDLLMCVRNGSEGLVGKTAMIEKDGMSFGAFMAIIRSKYNKFLYHFFQLDFFRKSVMQSRTSGINQISQNDIKNFKIPLPPLAVQEQIVMQVEALQSEIKGIDNELNALEQKRLALIQHYLSATNEKERERERVEQSLSKAEIIRLWTALTQDSAYIHSLDSQTQDFITSFDSLHLALIERKKALQDSITAIFTKLFHQDKPSIQDRIAHALPLGEVSSAESKLDSTPTPPPQGWEIKTLGDICEFRRGPFGGSLKKAIFVKNGYKVYEQQHAIKNDFSINRYFIDEYKFKEMKNFELVPNDIIMSCSGTIGKIAIAPLNLQKGIINQALLRLRLKKPIQATSNFMKILLEHINDIFQNNSYGSAIHNVTSVDTLKQIKIPLPPLAVQEQIVMQVEQIEEKIATTKQSRLELERELECYLESVL